MHACTHTSLIYTGAKLRLATLGDFPKTASIYWGTQFQLMKMCALVGKPIEISRADASWGCGLQALVWSIFPDPITLTLALQFLFMKFLFLMSILHSFFDKWQHHFGTENDRGKCKIQVYKFAKRQAQALLHNIWKMQSWGQKQTFLKWSSALLHMYYKPVCFSIPQLNSELFMSLKMKHVKLT